MTASKKIKVAFRPHSGWFLLTDEQVAFLAKHGVDVDEDGRLVDSVGFIPRHHPALIAAIEELPDGGLSEVREIDGDRYCISQNEWGETIITPDGIPWVVAE